MNEPSQIPDFEALMNQVKEHQCRDSFQQLFKVFFGNVVAYLKRSHVEEQKASELAQEVFILVWHKAQLFDANKGTFKVWLYTIVRNLKFDHFRSKQRDLLNLSSKDIYELSDDISDNFKDEHLIIDNDIRIRVNQLPQEQRDAIDSIYFEGYSQSEYAELRSLPLGTVKSRVRLAFAQLRKRMVDK